MDIFVRRLCSFVLSFFVPGKDKRIGRKNAMRTENYSTAVIIPTYISNALTYKLVESIVTWYPKILVLVVDDFTQLDEKNLIIMGKIKELASFNRQVVYLRTQKNLLKAGALNLGIEYLMNLPEKVRVVFTLDDDVEISQNAIALMRETLYSSKRIGAVCSFVKVINKNSNILTRLQALEYNNFNITKIADNKFLKGPLVMQGMFAGFRMSALKQAKGFTQGHLIEDYDITARLKNKNWRVKIASEAVAETKVPDTIEGLWKQRVRWSYGGLQVVKNYWKNIPSVFQDLVGHLLFLSLVFLIVLSFFSRKEGFENSIFLPVLIFLALIQFIFSLILGFITFATLPNKDIKDGLIKFSLIPEFIYCNILSVVLLGSYLFFFYGIVAENLAKRIKIFNKPYKWGILAFGKIGYSSTWGTRQDYKEGGLI